MNNLLNRFGRNSQKFPVKRIKANYIFSFAILVVLLTGFASFLLSDKHPISMHTFDPMKGGIQPTALTSEMINAEEIKTGQEDSGTIEFCNNASRYYMVSVQKNAMHKVSLSLSYDPGLYIFGSLIFYDRFGNLIENTSLVNKQTQASLNNGYQSGFCYIKININSTATCHYYEYYSPYHYYDLQYNKVQYTLLVNYSAQELTEIAGWTIFSICIALCGILFMIASTRKKILHSRLFQRLGITSFSEKVTKLIQERNARIARERKERNARVFQTKVRALVDRGTEATELSSNGFYDAAMKKWEEIYVQVNYLERETNPKPEGFNLSEQICAIQKGKMQTMLEHAQRQFEEAQRHYKNGLFVYARSKYAETSQTCDIILREDGSLNPSIAVMLESAKNLQEQVKSQIFFTEVEQECKEIEKGINEIQDNPFSRESKHSMQILQNFEYKIETLKKEIQDLGIIPELLQKIENTQGKVKLCREQLVAMDRGTVAPGGIQLLPPVVSQGGGDNENKSDLVSIAREYEFFGGKIRFKIRIKNLSPGVLTRLNLTLDLPPALIWATHVPSSFVRSGNGLHIPRLGVREQVAISFFLSPINCLSGTINATLSFSDSQDRPFALTMAPKEIEVTCPMFFTREEVNLARVKNLADQLHYAAQKALPVLEPKHFLQVFEITLAAVHQHDVVEVSRTIDKDENQAEAWFYGITKIKKAEMIIHVTAEREKRVIVLEVKGEDQKWVTALLADLEGQLRQKLSTAGIISEDNPFFDVELSVATGFCPFCAATLQKGQINDFETGTVFCTNCHTQITKSI